MKSCVGVRLQLVLEVSSAIVIRSAAERGRSGEREICTRYAPCRARGTSNGHLPCRILDTGGLVVSDCLFQVQMSRWSGGKDPGGGGVA